MASLKPFVINQTDIQFILDQLNFLPLFDESGNAIINWDGTGTVYNSKHVAYANLGGVQANIAAYGTSYQSVTDLAGLRDVSGLNNNLSLVNAEWGAVDQIFTRSAAADYANYSPIMQAVADYAYAAAKQYYGKYSDGSVSDGTPTGTFNVGNAVNTNYAISVGGTQTATDGTPITIPNVVDYTPRMISLATTTAGVVYDTWAGHSAENSALPLAERHQSNEIYYDADGVATVLDWGQLATVAEGGLGQVDPQARLAASAGQDDHFIGGLNPGVSPSNGFFVLFGQFFDHGLDFIGKSSGATIKIALATDDPLYGMLGPDGQPVHEITVSRATVQTIDANGPEYVNHTSPFIDQSQTYGSHAQLTNLLREWVPNLTTSASGDFHAGMELFDGKTLATSWTKPDGTVTHETLPTLNELQAHVIATGRDALTWEDVLDLRNRDATGHVTTGTSGSALLLDMNPRFTIDHLHAATGFIDINHDGLQNGGEKSQFQVVDDAIATLHDYVASSAYQTVRSGDSFGLVNGTLSLTLGTALAAGPSTIPPGTYTGANALMLWVNFANFNIVVPPGAVHSAVSDILMASVGDHYVAGDGRVNENFGLTSIHHIFHEEHNYQIQNLMDALHVQDVVTDDTTHAKLHEFQVQTAQLNAAGDYVVVNGALRAQAAAGDIQIFNANGTSAGYAVATDVTVNWDQDKMFNGAKLIVEMEYQHAAVDQYARNVTPNIQEFVGYSSSVNSAVTLEYSQAAFRFGHSTLRETIDTIDPTHGLTGKIMGYALKEAFLAPEKFAAIGPAAVLLGMSHQQMNEVDEFVTPALNQGLLGQPLDLAAINIARGRDLGIPTLNDFRAAIGLAQYTSWTDFGQNMQHPTSLVNFIAAYAFDGNMDRAQAVLDLVDGAYASPAAGLALGTLLGWTAEVASGISAVTARAFAFLEGGDQSFNLIDTWIGGLAEIHQPGGLLGETFDKVFVNQIESLMDGDRFYYLFRLAGQQFAEEVGNGQLKDIVERNTGLTHLNGNIFGYADKYYDLAAKKEVSVDGAETQTTANDHKYGDVYDTNSVKIADGALTTHPTLGVYSNGGRSSVLDGTVVTINGVDYIRDTRLEDTGADTGAALLNDGVNLDGTPNSGAESSEVIVATSRDDLIYAQGGDDTVYGDGGNDTIYGGYGIDRLYGGDGADKLYGGDNPDLMDGGAGDDFLWGESSGSDINGADQVIGGSGNDFISGGIGIDKLSGGTGDDRIYGDQDTDPFTHGSDGNDYVDGGSGGDILYGDNGDDVLVGGADQDQMFGGNGDDIIRPGDTTGALTIGTDEVLGGDGVTDEGNKPGTLGFDLIDFSDNAVRPGGVTFNLADQQNPAVNVNGIPKQIAAFQTEGLIGSTGNDTLTGDSAGDAGLADASLDKGENWLIGGSGADLLTGGGGNDIIVGGSIRLDTLIGKYNSGYTHNNGNTGATAADQLQDALYQGASHRVLYSETIDNTGLIDAVNATIPGTANDFAKHFTELLRTEMFKDTVLGDGRADASTTNNADIAIYTGKFTDYKITAVPFNSANADGSLVAYKIVDLRDPAGVDANGVVIPTDGTDLVVGVEKLQFSDRTISLINTPPVLDLNAAHVVTTTTNGQYRDNFGTAAFNISNGTTAWAATPWVETDDNGNVSNPSAGQITITGGVLRFGDNDTDAGTGSAAIQRTVNLAGVSSATVSYSYIENSFDAGEIVTVTFSDDGSFGAGHTQTIQTIDASSNNGSINNVTLAGNLSASAAIRFVVSGTNSNSATDAVSIDNLRIDTVTSTTATVSGTAGTGNTSSYTENSNTRAPISSFPSITDDGTMLASAKVVLTNPVSGDLLRIGNSNSPSGNLTGSLSGIQYTVSTAGGVVTLDLTGNATLAQYQSAIDQVRFYSTSDDPTAHGTNVDRVIHVTVNDGLVDSNVATATVHVVPANDRPNAGDDYVVTNQQTVVVSEGLLLANDTDVDGPNPLDIVATSNSNSLTSASLTTNPGSVTIVDGATGTAGGSFVYTVSDGGSANATDTATVALTVQTGTSISGATGSNSGRGEILIGGSGSETITGGGGNDIVLAGGGNDNVIWNATSNTSGSNVTTDGRDFVDGGDGTDTFTLTSSVNGNNGNETFDIYSRAAATGITINNDATEIVITRNGTVIAELANVEEIVINTGPGTNQFPANLGTGDKVFIHGDFTGTSLAYSTITINGGAGDDSVDITGLTSDHRIVFHGGGGDDQVVGTLRPQDVVDAQNVLPSGDPGGPTGGGQDDSGQGGSGDDHGGNSGGDDQHCSSGDHDHHGDDGTSIQPADSPGLPTAHIGTPGDDVMVGAAGDDVFSGLEGDDVILGNDGADTLKAGAGDDLVKAGTGDDVVFGNEGNDDLFGGTGKDLMTGDAGDDRLFGDAGDDALEAGVGGDTVYGGAGNDRVLATVGDGDDTYFGDAEEDTLDYSAIAASITADLGNGIGQHGSVTSGQSGTDKVFGFEDFIGGSGNDTIVASSVANVMDGGGGNDTFVFGSAGDAEGDMIKGFQPGDKIDLSAIDANTGASGAQSFVLFAGNVFTSAGQVIVTHEIRDGLEHTMVAGNTNNDTVADFKVDIAGNHALTSADFNGVH
jgi:Ca2+-binding RTX toxin-like protein